DAARQAPEGLHPGAALHGLPEACLLCHVDEQAAERVVIRMTCPENVTLEHRIAAFAAAKHQSDASLAPGERGGAPCVPALRLGEQLGDRAAEQLVLGESFEELHETRMRAPNESVRRDHDERD